MAYVDNNHARPSAATIIGTLLINGVMVAGILSAVPNVIPETFKPFTLINTATKPPPPKPIERQQTKPDKVVTAGNPVSFKPLTIPTTPIITPVDVDFKMPVGDLGGGSLGDDLTQIKPITPPVEIGARLNMRNPSDLQPSYPLDLIRLGVEGSVTVRVLVGTDGRVKAVEPLRVADQGFLKVTREQALRKWRFSPATRDGVAIESWREMTVRFQLPD
jgi:periplasmic protein TonB